MVLLPKKLRVSFATQIFWAGVLCAGIIVYSAIALGVFHLELGRWPRLIGLGIGGLIATLTYGYVQQFEFSAKASQIVSNASLLGSFALLFLYAAVGSWTADPILSLLTSAAFTFGMLESIILRTKTLSFKATP